MRQDRREPTEAVNGLILDLGGVVLSWTPAAFASSLDTTWEQRLGLPHGEIARKVWQAPERRAAELGQLTTTEFWTEVLFVDDRAVNIDAAKEIGLHVLLCAGPDQLMVESTAVLNIFR
jgi:hypothetical protein